MIKRINITWLAILPLVAFIIAISAARAREPEKKPAIQWTPPAITTVISIGQPHTINVSLQNFVNLRDVSLFVSDATVARFVTISPAQLPRLKKNTVTPVAITFSVPQSTVTPSLQSLTGAIKIKTTKHRDKDDVDDDDRRLFPPLLFNLTISDDTTVGGTDANNNGIRDDIDQYIQQTFTDAGQKAAAVQMASAMQAAILHAGDKAASLSNGSRLTAATDCISSYSDPAVRNKLIDIQPLTLNTQVRTTAWLAFNDQVAGGYFTGIVGNKLSDACTQ
jgi:hypothetical protein